MSRRPARARCYHVLLASAVALASQVAVAAADDTAIRAAIAAQLDAFRHDDADGAYRLASPHIEARFGSAANFLAMVKMAYPAVYRAHDVDFGPVVRRDGAIVEQVGLVGPDGTRAVALYTMEREANGAWRIDGCVLEEIPSEGA